MDEQFDILFTARVLSDFPTYCNEIKHLPLPQFHVDSVNLIVKNRYCLVEFPVGHFKTTTYTQNYGEWRAIGQKNQDICLVSSSLDQSIGFLDKIKTDFEAYPFLNQFVPKDASSTWKSDKLKLVNGSVIYVKPFNASARGIQTDWLIFDDILRDDKISDEDTIDIFYSIFFERVQLKKGQILIVGTPQSETDLYQTLKRRPNWVCLKHHALQYDSNGNPCGTLLPEKFTIERLLEIKEEIGERRFNREYQCETMSDTERVIPMNQINNAVDNHLDFDLKTGGRVFIGADLAMSASPKGDFSVFIVVDFVPTFTKTTDIVGGGTVTEVVKNAIVVKKMVREKGLQPSQQTSMLEQLALLYHPERIIVDESQWGVTVIQELRNKGYPAIGEGFHPKNRDRLITQLIMRFNTGNVVLPHSTNSNYYTDILIGELSRLTMLRTPRGSTSYGTRSGHDDSIIALSLATSQIQVSSSLMKSIIAMGKKRDDIKRGFHL